MLLRLLKTCVHVTEKWLVISELAIENYSIILQKNLKFFSVAEHLLEILLTPTLELCNWRNSHREFNIWWNNQKSCFVELIWTAVFVLKISQIYSAVFLIIFSKYPTSYRWTELHFARHIRSFRICSIWYAMALAWKVIVAQNFEKYTWKSSIFSNFMENEEKRSWKK